jgi:hypothetical protein
MQRRLLPLKAELTHGRVGTHTTSPGMMLPPRDDAADDAGDGSRCVGEGDNSTASGNTSGVPLSTAAPAAPAVQPIAQGSLSVTLARALQRWTSCES